MFSLQLLSLVNYYLQILKIKITQYNKFVLSPLVLCYFTHFPQQNVLQCSVNLRLISPFIAASRFSLSLFKVICPNLFDSFIHSIGYSLFTGRVTKEIVFWNSNNSTSNFVILSLYGLTNDSYLPC